jgi:hypothetical protein
MNRILTKRLTLALMALAVACLASAVFLWGTEYKCSLYHKHPDRHPRITMAKLLSERERPAGGAVPSVRASLPQTVFVALAMLVPGLFGRTRVGFDPILLPAPGVPAIDRSRFLIHFSFRPPPPMTV